MPIHIAAGEKFACFAFTFYGLAGDVPDEVELDPRLWVVRKLDLDVAKHWDEWMGSITMNALRDSKFVIYTTMPSSHPKDHDQENLDLVETLNYPCMGFSDAEYPSTSRGSH